jgi:hypothetical protein
MLAALGWARIDDTRVMVCPAQPSPGPGIAPALPAAMHWRALSAADCAQTIGELRGSDVAQRWGRTPSACAGRRCHTAHRDLP